MKRRFIQLGTFIVLSLLLMISAACTRRESVYGLTCDYKVNPVGLDNKHPKFSWNIIPEGFDQYQSAYRILVSDEKGRICWDSKQVTSDQSTLIPYAGESLQSGNTYSWKVRIWDEEGSVSAWSESASWTTGMMNADEWKAGWIASESSEPTNEAPFFRKEFDIKKRVAKAHAFVSGLGYYELRINGEKIGNRVLDPAQTDYEKRVFYSVFDVTDNLVKGDNALGLIVGNGWYNQQVAWGGRTYGVPRVMLQVHISYGDGSEEIVVSDKSWKTSYGPIVYNSIYQGEIYDARLEMPGWDLADFDDTGWNEAVEVESPGGVLMAQSIPPIREIEKITPVKIFYPEAGMRVYDLGQNISGYSEISLSGAPGTLINLRFAETIDQEGYIDVASTGVMATTSEQIDRYYCRGDGLETFKPRFTYHGFRYVEVSGAPSIPADFNLTGIVVHTDARSAGHFECSDTLLNRISQTALWTLRGNMHGLLTDCPHRERCGWLGDAHLAGESTIFHLQSADFWIKYIRDIETSLDKGLPTNVAPGLRIKWVGRADWGAAIVLLPWYVYQYYGDLSIIEEQYPNMKRYIQYLEEISEEGVVNNGFGDWYDPPSEGPEAISVPNPKYTSTGITSTSLYYAALQIMVRASRLLDHADDLIYYQRLEAETRKAFNKHFYSVDSAYGSQTANTVALRFNLVEEENREHVLEALIEDILAHESHFTTGVQGAKHLYNILSENGYGDLAYQVITNKTFPSIPYLFSLGATTNWENWSTTTNQRGVPRSKNHPMNTGYAAWFFQSVAGIKPDPGLPGFKRIILSPDFNRELAWVKASYLSPYGKVVSSWQKEKTGIEWQISVPPNTTAEIILPQGYGSIKRGLENGIKSETEAGGYIIGSGNYQLFISE